MTAPSESLARRKETCTGPLRDTPVMSRMRMTAGVVLLWLGCLAMESISQELTQPIRAREFARAAEAALAKGDPADAALLAARAHALHQSGEAPLLYLRALDRLPAMGPWLRGHSAMIRTMSFSPNGQLLVTASDDGTARIWSTRTGQTRWILRHAKPVWRAAFSPDGRLVVTGSADSTARLWRVTDGSLVAILKGHSSTVSRAAFSPDGKLLVTGGFDKQARVWEVPSGKFLRLLQGHKGGLTAVAFSPTGGTIVTASWDATARLWSARSGALLAVLRGHSRSVDAVAFAPDGRQLITGSADRTARIWNVATGKLSRILRGHGDRVRSCAFSPDGRQVLTSAYDRTARLWDAHSGAQHLVLRGHYNGLNGAIYTRDGRYVITSALGGRTILWRRETGRRTAVVGGDWFTPAVCSRDGRLLATVGRGATVRIRHLRATVLDTELPGSFDAYGPVGFSPDGKLLLTVTDMFSGSTPHLWESESGKLRAVLKGYAHQLTNAVFSPDSRKLLTSSDYDDTVPIYDTASGQLLQRIKNSEEGGVLSAVFSPDSRSVLNADGEHARLWNAENGTPLAAIGGDVSAPSNARFSRNGRELVTFDGEGVCLRSAKTRKLRRFLEGQQGRLFWADYRPSIKRVLAVFTTPSYGWPHQRGKGSACLWDSETGKIMATMRGYKSPQVVAGFSPSGKLVLTAGDRKAHIWDAVSGKQLAALSGHSAAIAAWAFSPDGTLLVTAARSTAFMGKHDPNPRLWQTQTGKLRAVLVGHSVGVQSVSFSKDGRWILTTSDDGTARLWRAKTGQLQAVLTGYGSDVMQGSFSPDGRRFVTASHSITRITTLGPLTRTPAQMMRQARWRTGMLLVGATVTVEPLLQMPRMKLSLPALPAQAIRSLFGGLPAEKRLSAICKTILGNRDPALAWLALYHALEPAARANSVRLLVLERLEAAVAGKQSRFHATLSLSLQLARIGPAKERLAPFLATARKSALKHPLVLAVALLLLKKK